MLSRPVLSSKASSDSGDAMSVTARRRVKPVSSDSKSPRRASTFGANSWGCFSARSSCATTTVTPSPPQRERRMDQYEIDGRDDLPTGE